jgi:6-hydroxynicotinate reductase
MHVIDENKCKKCGICVENCPVEAIAQKDRKSCPSVMGGICVDCNLCSKLCPVEAISQVPSDKKNAMMCRSCPIHCVIPQGRTGACHRFINADATNLKRTRPLLIPRFADLDERKRLVALTRPLLTGIGAGTLYPIPSRRPMSPRAGWRRLTLSPP